MYGIKENKEKYKTFTLYNTAEKSSFTINPERGGIVTAFQVEGIGDILYMNEEIYRDPSKYIRGGIPVLFPMTGRLSDDSYWIQNTKYSMPVHGLVRNYPWEVRSACFTDSAEITVGIKSSQETMKAFPFSFDLEYTYTLKENTLTVRQCIKNLSENVMPVSFGFHPYFKVRNKENAEVLLDSANYKDMVTGAIVPVSAPLDFTKKPETGCLFMNVSRQRAVLQADGYRTEITFGENYRHVLLWSLAEEDFICVEPWTAKPDALNTKEDLICINPGEEVRSYMKITVTKESD